jgi:hypothetical protein
MLNYKILSTAILLSAQTLIFVSAVPLQTEGTSCQHLGCKADGTSREYCQGGSTTVSGQVGLCPEAQVCVMTEFIQGNFHCDFPGQALLQAPAVQPPVGEEKEAAKLPVNTLPAAGPSPSQITTSNDVVIPATPNAYPEGWKDKNARKDNRITYYENVADLTKTACGGNAVGYNDREPYITAMDTGFFGDNLAPGYNPNEASVCGKKIKLSCKSS